MARGPLTFRQRDVVAAIRAVEASGHRVGRVSIGRDGQIVIDIAAEAPATSQAPAPSAGNEWDEILEDNPPLRPALR